MANTLMIDTNLFLDFLLDREAFSDDAETILKASANRTIRACICPNSVCDIFYIHNKYVKNINLTYEMLGIILKCVTVAPLMGIDILKAYDSKAKDFEDHVIGEAAIASKCDGIITRDKEGFEGLNIPIYTPKEAIEKFL